MKILLALGIHYPRLLLVNLGTKTGFFTILNGIQNFRGFQEDRTDRTVLLAKFQAIWWYMVSESPLFNIFRQTDISMYQKWPSKPSILSRVSPGHLYYLFFEFSPTYFSKKNTKRKNLENRKSENLKIQKPRFTNKCPTQLGPAWFSSDRLGSGWLGPCSAQLGPGSPQLGSAGWARPGLARPMNPF